MSNTTYSVKKTQNSAILDECFVAFGRKYYKSSLQFICDNIKVMFKNKEIDFDIRKIEVDNYKLTITTYFNENNLNVLTCPTDVQQFINKLIPKYEHFVNHTNTNLYITVDEKDNPDKITWDAISFEENTYKNGKLINKKDIIEIKNINLKD